MVFNHIEHCKFNEQYRHRQIFCSKISSCSTILNIGSSMNKHKQSDGTSCGGAFVIIHRHNSTHRLISRHYPEDSDVPLLYTPQTSPLCATKCIPQREYHIRHYQYAAIRFHRRGVLSPVSLQYQQTDFNLLGRTNVCGPGYSFAF